MKALSSLACFKRGAVGNNAVPANFGLVDVGSLTTNVEYTTVGLSRSKTCTGSRTLVL